MSEGEWYWLVREDEGKYYTVVYTSDTFNIFKDLFCTFFPLICMKKNSIPCRDYWIKEYTYSIISFIISSQENIYLNPVFSLHLYNLQTHA